MGWGVRVANVTLPTSRTYPEFSQTALIVAIEVCLAFLLGTGLMVLGTDGGSWILGGIAAGALVIYGYRHRTQQSITPNRNLRKIGQLLVGLTVGFSIQHLDLPVISSYLPVFLLMTVFLLSGAGVVGYLYSTLTRIDLLTAMLSTVPGNIGVMASIAADYGKNPPLVSFVQLMRFTAITLIIPMIANVSHPHNVTETLVAITRDLTIFNPAYLGLLSFVLFSAWGAAHVGTKLRIPVAALLCSIVVGALFNGWLDAIPFLPHVEFTIPPILNLIGQILLGITIGEYWGINPKLSRLTVVGATIPVVLTCLTGLMSAGLAKWLTPWDWLTCLLVASPGGSPEMIWIALALNHDVEIVTAGHIIRLVAINLSLPLLITIANHLQTRSIPNSDTSKKLLA